MPPGVSFLLLFTSRTLRGLSSSSILFQALLVDIACYLVWSPGVVGVVVTDVAVLGPLPRRLSFLVRSLTTSLSNSCIRLRSSVTVALPIWLFVEKFCTAATDVPLLGVVGIACCICE